MAIKIELEPRHRTCVGVRGKKPLLRQFRVIVAVNRVSQSVEGCARFLAIAPAKAVEAFEGHLLSHPSAFESYVDLFVLVGLEQTGSLAGNRDEFCAKPRGMSGLEKRLKVCLISIHKMNPRLDRVTVGSKVQRGWLVANVFRYVFYRFMVTVTRPVTSAYYYTPFRIQLL